MSEEAPHEHAYLTELTTEIVSAYVSRNPVSPSDLPTLIASTHAALQGLGQPTPEPQPELKPAVPIRKSITPDYIISLEDGRQYKSLKRHLAGRGMTPNQYREKWGLPSDYPMVTASYSAKRSELARASGLGRKAKEAAVVEAPAVSEQTAPTAEKPKRERKKIGLTV